MTHRKSIGAVRTLGVSLLASIVMTASFVAPAWSQSSSESGVPYAGAPAPSQSRVLEPWTGSWTLDIEVSGSGGADGVRFSGQATGQSLLNGQFVRVDGRTSNGESREAYFVLYWYDAGEAVYRREYFSSIGLVSRFEGTWDDARQEMTWVLQNPSGGQTGTIVDTIAPEGITTRVVYRDGDGKVARSVVIRAAREPR